MSPIGQPERATQNQVIAPFRKDWKFRRQQLNHLPIRHMDWDF